MVYQKSNQLIILWGVRKGGLVNSMWKMPFSAAKWKLGISQRLMGGSLPPPHPPSSISTSLKILYHRTSIKVSLTSVVKNHTHFRIYSHENLSYYILESYLFNEIALQNKLVNFEFLTYVFLSAVRSRLQRNILKSFVLCKAGKKINLSCIYFFLNFYCKNELI